MRFSNLIFDLDGTLVDSAPGIESSINYTIRECCLKADGAIREQIGPVIPKMFANMWPELDAAELENRVAIFRRHYDEKGCLQASLYPKVRETLVSLRSAGAAMFVLTNKPSFATRKILTATKTINFFEDVISPDTAATSFVSKSVAADYLRRQHRLAPTKTVIIGDGTDDAYAAQHCGFAFILALYGYGKAALEGTDAAAVGLKSFGELPCLLR